MPIAQVNGRIHTDTDMEHGYVEIFVEAGRVEAYFMTPATFARLMQHGLMAEVLDTLESAGHGVHLIPRSIVERALSRELDRSLEFLEPGESDQCALPTCLQDAVSRERGYPLCAVHAAQHADWDSLTA